MVFKESKVQFQKKKEQKKKRVRRKFKFGEKKEINNKNITAF